MQVSGSCSHREDSRRWQRQVLAWGWSGLGVAEGLYSPAAERVTCQFQTERNREEYSGSPADGLIGGRARKGAREKPIP